MTKSLTVAVTGPTGEIGISAVEALERDPDVSQPRYTSRETLSEMAASLHA